MKWFKHITDSGDDPHIDDSITRFGPLGYYVFFRTLEVMGREFNNSDPGRNTFSVSYFRSKFRCNWKSIRNILEFYNNRKRIVFKLHDNDGIPHITLFCPKLKTLCDDYTQKELRKKSGHDPGNIRSVSGTETEPEVPRELFTNVNNPAPAGWESIPQDLIPDLEEICKTLTVPNGNGRVAFPRAYQFVNAMQLEGARPEALLTALTALAKSGTKVKSPYPWARAICRKETQNLNERKEIERHENAKKENPLKEYIDNW